MEAGQVVLILIALVAANLPFFSDRIFFIVTPKAIVPDEHGGGLSGSDDVQKEEVIVREGEKGLVWRLFELVVLYFLVGGAAYLLESRLGTPHQQGWEFYAITACLFLVFAYPGFVAKYLWNARGR